MGGPASELAHVKKGLLHAGAVMHVPLGERDSKTTTATLSILWLLKAAQDDTTSALLLVSNDSSPLCAMLSMPCLRRSLHIAVAASVPYNDARNA